LSFDIIDRRGNKKTEDAPAPKIHLVDEKPKEKGKWKDKITYMLSLTPIPPNGALVIGRAAAMRSDGLPFLADYVLPQPLWNEGFQWEPKARERLETFLDCDCGPHHPCSTHQILIPQWAQADMQRISLSGSDPIPEVIEVLFKAEQARKNSSIVVPR
jgi:hypothetical protein